MKTNILLIVIVAFLFTSCAPGVPTQAIEVTAHTPTKIPFTAVPTTAQPATETPTATATPTIVPSQTPPSCLALLTPSDGEEFPAMGRVTFSWSPVNDTTFYALTIMSPSGETVSFETKQPIRALYLEALPAGGTYQWKVIAEDRKRNEICSSELATFSKPTYTGPNQPVNDKKKKKK
jgi:hypothetical protein